MSSGSDGDGGGGGGEPFIALHNVKKVYRRGGGEAFLAVSDVVLETVGAPG